MKATASKRADRLAVLIDAENISARYVGPLLNEIAQLGTASVKRIYGDWTLPEQGRWKHALNSHAIIPVHQFRLSSGKNATDCALIIDAMDLLLYTGKFDGFCLVSSDSDFARLACRIRESGLTVYGFGEEKTPASFVQACDRFIKLENLCVADVPVAEVRELGPDAVEAKTSSGKLTGDAGSPRSAIDIPRPTPARRPASTVEANGNLTSLVRKAYDSASGEDGWASMAMFGARLLKLSPAFDCRDYGTRRLGELVQSLGMFDIKKIPSTKNSTSTAWYIRAKVDPSEAR